MSMPKITTISILILSHIGLCFSCENKNSNIYSKIDDGSILSSKYQTPKENWIYTYTMDQNKALSLDSLQNGYKDFQLRIWIHAWLKIKKKCILLSRTNKKWGGELIIATYKYNDSLQDHFIVGQERKQITPKSGWDNFFKSLEKLEFFKLPDMDDLANYIRGDDGTDYVFEIATPSKYRMFHYWSPEYNSKVFWQAKKMELISQLIYKELIENNE
jgi:hypothetical protein